MTYPRLADSLITLRGQVNLAAPNRRKESDSGVIPDLRHQSTISDHNANSDGVVLALDLTHDPDNGADMQKIADSIIVSHDPRIWYIIFNHRIWEAGIGWRPYTGYMPHEHHAHFNTNYDPKKYDSKTKWNIGEEVMTPEQVDIKYQLAMNRRSTKEELKLHTGRPSAKLDIEILNSVENRRLRTRAANFVRVETALKAEQSEDDHKKLVELKNELKKIIEEK